MTNNPKALAQIGPIFLTWRRYLQRELLPYRITLKQLYVLRQLTREDFLYPSTIADMLYCDRPTATVVINNMVKQGWIVKTTDPLNRKQIQIRLTETGRDFLTKIENQTTHTEQTFDPMECFSTEELQQLEQLLSKWQNHMKKIE